MSEFQGMDTEQIADLSALLSNRAGTLSTLLDDLAVTVDSTVGTLWVGPDADTFSTTFRSSVQPRFTSAVDALTGRGTELDGHREEQETTSSADIGVAGSPQAGPGSPQAGPGTPGASSNFLGADWGDVSFGEFWQNVKENIGIDGVDGAGGIVGITHSFAKNFGDFAFGKGSVPAFIPMIGDAFTGIMAGVDRWNDDAGRTDLSTGERIGRAVLDGGVNFAGSLIGSAIGGAIGTGLGSSIGGLFGGGGGAAAGAPAAGVGAVPGAAAGGAAGVGVGGVVGGIVGDVVGSYIGATTADSVIDTFLD
ncbi:hypothetical protein CFK41_03960 [Brachybacterium ginsengisoli]|uniref:WXG100 family type VII secretion target n=1 Tax=Brachybacterium ginsengisoli TaxID=1331682 RepID=A0A291GUW6_9MICO|nr:hypothetical protein [Brachybacterium ginsengisoli]ATG54021.1 hypothetical protein CFK41_03960 [Brachybacterium ginsengisoli]